MECPTHAHAPAAPAGIRICGYFLPQLRFHGVLWSERCTGLHILVFTSISMASARSRFQQQHQMHHPQPNWMGEQGRVSPMPN